MIVKVNIIFPNNPPNEYELNRELPLRLHVDTLCKHFNIPNANPIDYTLQLNTTGVYFTDEVFFKKNINKKKKFIFLLKKY